MTFDITIDFDEIVKEAEKLGVAPEVINREMLTAVQASLDAFEQAVVVETPVNTGHLRGSINSVVYGSPPDFFGVVSSPILYASPVEYGRKPGRQPPVDAIAYWVRRKNLVPDDQVESVAYLIARHIGRYGTKGAHMFEKGFNNALPAVERLWDDVSDKIVEQMQ